MSRLGDIEAAVIAAIDAVVALKGTTRGPTAIDTIPVDKLPHVQSFNPGRERGQLEIGLGLLRSADTFYTVTFEKANHSRETILDYADQIADAIDADPTLGGLVEWAWVAVDGIDETTDDVRTTLNLQVTAEVSK